MEPILSQTAVLSVAKMSTIILKMTQRISETSENVSEPRCFRGVRQVTSTQPHCNTRGSSTIFVIFSISLISWFPPRSPR